MSAEIAISPANPFTKQGPGGNESTSVGWSFPRKRRFSERNSELPVTSTLTVPLSWLARLARATNFARAVSLNPATGLRRITKLFFFARFAEFFALYAVKAFAAPTPKINRRATFGHPPVQSYPLYSLVSTSEEGSVSFSRDAISVPLALPFVLDSSNGNCSTTLALCSS